MKHEIFITPLNCSFGTGLTTLLRVNESEYNADTERSIYAPDVMKSWFKMKSGPANTPYLEPVLFDLLPGDLIEIEFNALKKSGSNVGINIHFGKIPTDYQFKATWYAQETAPTLLDTYFKSYKVRYVLPPNTGEAGVLVNVRPFGYNSEAIIKDFKISVTTKNPNFRLKHYLVDFNGKTDFLKAVDFISGTNLSPSWNGLSAAQTLAFPDTQTMQFTGTDTTNFKGVCSMMNGWKHNQAIMVYAEYKTNDTDHLSFTLKSLDETEGTYSIKSVNLPATSTFKKAVIYTNTTGEYRKALLDLGRVASSTLSLKRVIFSQVQFDDYIGRKPNQLEELYTNLKLKLR